MMLFTKSARSRRSVSLRPVSLFLVAFLLLASARALVPGMCATLAAVDSKPEAACCAHRTAADGPVVAPVQDTHPACAFCALAKGNVTPGSAASAPGVSGIATVAGSTAVAEPDTACHWNPASRRGPPASAPAC